MMVMVNIIMNRMDKTVENIKKFLHISPKKKKNEAKIEEANGVYPQDRRLHRHHIMNRNHNQDSNAMIMILIFIPRSEKITNSGRKDSDHKN